MQNIAQVHNFHGTCRLVDEQGKYDVPYELPGDGMTVLPDQPQLLTFTPEITNKNIEFVLRDLYSATYGT
ncbi:hypothetical protein RBLE17_00430 [Rhodobacteraceae bacterium LE17]|nr:hypothetical protein [Rhodobacteraceae bacterium LE17]